MSGQRIYRDPRVIKCLECKGSGCEECKQRGEIRVPTRAEYAAQEKLYELRDAEVRELRRRLPESAIIPCGICGKLMQEHSLLGDRPLCPMDGPPGLVFYPTLSVRRGDLVCLTAAAAKRHNVRDPKRIGKIVGESRDKTSWLVRWKTPGTPQSWHKSFLTRPPTTPQPTNHPL